MSKDYNVMYNTPATGTVCVSCLRSLLPASDDWVRYRRFRGTNALQSVNFIQRGSKTVWSVHQRFYGYECWCLARVLPFGHSMSPGMSPDPLPPLPRDVAHQ